MGDDLNRGRGGVPAPDEEPGAAESVGTEADAGGAEATPEGAAAAIAEARREAEEQKDRYLRLAAEFDNYRKRTLRERQETTARAQGELMSRILDSVDDLARVTAVNPEGVDPRSVVDGVAAVQTKLMRALGALGLEVVNPIDQPFNPELHEAVATERALSPEDDHLVAQVYQPGYVFQGQLLRPARVVVKQWSE